MIESQALESASNELDLNLCFGQEWVGGLDSFRPAAVTEFERGQVRSFAYLEPDHGAAISENNLPDRLFELVAESARAWFKAIPRVTLALSGGFDSRFLAALYCRERGVDTTAYSLSVTQAETTTAKAVAAALRLHFQVVELGSSAWSFHFSPKPAFWDRYGGEYQVTADGFPLSKHPIYTLAFDCPGIRS